MKNGVRVAGGAVLALFAIMSAMAQQKVAEEKGIQGAFLKQSMSVEKEFVDLAQAIPQEKYTWRPMEGVRSIAEAFLHVAAGNYVTLTTMGGKLPEGVDMRTFEKSTTDKAAIVEGIRKSFRAINDYIAQVSEKDFDRTVNFFGNTMSVLDMIMLAANHQHETLGQVIAYSRMNQIVPPWTAARQARMQQQQKKN
jgi:uncharacterized damage-inducible protein DinB